MLNASFKLFAVLATTWVTTRTVRNIRNMLHRSIPKHQRNYFRIKLKYLRALWSSGKLLTTFLNEMMPTPRITIPAPLILKIHNIRFKIITSKSICLPVNIRNDRKGQILPDEREDAVSGLDQGH
jgi:hypothetical protein